MYKESVDVLYIHPTQKPNNTLYGIMPMGVIGLINELHKCDILIKGYNMAIEKYIDEKISAEDILKNMKYKILLVDLHWYEHSYNTIQIALISKRLNPDIPVIIGGYTSTIFADEIMKKYNCVDYIICGDSEVPIVKLVKCLLMGDKQELKNIPNIWYRDSGKIYSSKYKWVASSIDDIDFVDYDWIENSKFVPYITTEGVKKIVPSYWLCIARGCKYDCSYCCGGNHNMEKLFHRCNILLRKPEVIANDILKLTKKNICHICFSHDPQMFGFDFYKKLFYCIRQLKIKPGMYLECFQLPTKGFIDEILLTFDVENIILVISPISGNEFVRKKNGKLFSNSSFIDILQYIKKNRIRLQLYYTQNLYKETKDEFWDTYNQIKYIHDGLGLSKRCFFYQPIVIDPLAGMREYENIKVFYHTFEDYYRYCASNLPNYGWCDEGELSLEEKESYFKRI